MQEFEHANAHGHAYGIRVDTCRAGSPQADARRVIRTRQHGRMTTTSAQPVSGARARTAAHAGDVGACAPQSVGVRVRRSLLVASPGLLRVYCRIGWPRIPTSGGHGRREGVRPRSSPRSVDTSSRLSRPFCHVVHRAPLRLQLRLQLTRWHPPRLVRLARHLGPTRAARLVGGAAPVAPAAVRTEGALASARSPSSSSRISVADIGRSAA